VFGDPNLGAVFGFSSFDTKNRNPEAFLGEVFNLCVQVLARCDGPRETQKFLFARPQDPNVTWGFGNLATHPGFRFLQGMMGPESPQSAPLAAP
jgi:hypothetical protein